MVSKYSTIHEDSFDTLWRERAKLSYHTVEEFGAKGNISEAVVSQILQGGIDMHIHGFPDALVDTGWDFAYEAKQAYDAGMRGVVCKSMLSDTAPMCYFVNQIIDQHAREKEERGELPRHPFNAFGGVVLNLSVGGLNPEATWVSAKLGAKIIWLPSHDSTHHMKVLEETGPSVDVLDGNDHIRPELVEIFKIVAEHDIILDLCHTGTKERFVITEEALKHGVKKVLLTHPQWSVNRMSIDQMVEISKMGAYIGLFMYSAVPHFNNPVCDRTEVLTIIEKVTPERCAIATDFGSMLNPPPLEGMKLYIRLLLAMGVSAEDIRTMLVNNNSYLCGVD